MGDLQRKSINLSMGNLMTTDAIFTLSYKGGDRSLMHCARMHLGRMPYMDARGMHEDCVYHELFGSEIYASAR